MTALPLQWNPDTWGGPIPAATTPDPDDLTHAAHRIRADLAMPVSPWDDSWGYQNGVTK